MIIYEKTFSSLPLPATTQLELTQCNPGTTISLTNKSARISNLECLQAIQTVNSDLTLIPYYALIHHQRVSAAETAQPYLTELKQYAELGVKDSLLVSGYPKPRHDSLSILKVIAPDYSHQEYPRLAVAYNPFLTGQAFLIEQHRLTEKIRTGIVASVYLQIGIDIMVIRSAVDWLREVEPPLDIYLSVMNPSKARLAQFKYRPWAGVHLSEAYLSSAEQARIINQQLYQLAQKLQIGIIQGE